MADGCELCGVLLLCGWLSESEFTELENLQNKKRYKPAFNSRLKFGLL